MSLLIVIRVPGRIIGDFEGTLFRILWHKFMLIKSQNDLSAALTAGEMLYEDANVQDGVLQGAIKTCH